MLIDDDDHGLVKVFKSTPLYVCCIDCKLDRLLSSDSQISYQYCVSGTEGYRITSNTMAVLNLVRVPYSVHVRVL